jgi:hypothetical protein
MPRTAHQGNAMGIQDRDYYNDKHDELHGRKGATRQGQPRQFSEDKYAREMRKAMAAESYRRKGQTVPSWAPWIMAACLLLLVVIVILAWELRTR